MTSNSLVFYSESVKYLLCREQLSKWRTATGGPVITPSIIVITPSIIVIPENMQHQLVHRNCTPNSFENIPVPFASSTDLHHVVEGCEGD